MARFATSSALALLALAAACISAMPMMPEKAYCETTTGGNAMIITNANTLGLVMDTTEASGSSCRSTFNYEMDSAMTGNVSLVRTSWNCDDDSDGIVSWFTYDMATDMITMMAEDPSANNVRKFILAPCAATAPTSMHMANGSYCTAGSNIVTTGKWYMWTQSWGTSTCSELGTYDISQSAANVFEPSTTTPCSTGFSITTFWASSAANTMGMRMYSSSRVATFTAEACSTIDTASPDVDTTYCVQNVPANDKYNGMMIHTAADGSYWMVGPNAVHGVESPSVCSRTGSFWSLGTTFSMSASSTDSCVASESGLPRFTVGKFFSSNNSLVFANENGVWFNASKCEAAVTTLPTGRYCGGENAEMYIGKDVVQISTDYNQMIMREVIVASYAPVTGGIQLNTDTLNTNGSTLASIQIRVAGSGGIVSLTWMRGTKSEGYSFSQSFCGNVTMAGVAPAPVPADNYCFNNGTLSTNNGAFALYLNQPWVPSSNSECAYGGIMNHRSGAISYRMDMTSCANAEFTNVFLSDIMYSSTAGISFVLTNETSSNAANTTVTAASCTANTQYFASKTYCSMTNRSAGQTYGAPTSMPPATVFNTGSSLVVVYWEEPCVGVNKVSGQAGMVTNFTNPIGHAACQAKAIHTLANGDLHFVVNTHVALISVSSSSCGTSYLSPAVVVPGAYCGNALPSSTTAAPSPAPVNGSLMLGDVASIGKFSMGVSQNGLLTIFIQPTTSDAPVRLSGTAWTNPGGAFDYHVTSWSSSMWRFPMIMQNNDGSLEITIQYNDNTPFTFTASAATCTAWGTSGLASGVYMGASELTTQAVVMGDLMSFDVTSNGPYWINVSSTANTNVTYSAAWPTNGTANALPLWINTVGSNGLAVSTTVGTLAGVLNGNLDHSALPAWSVMSSAAIPALGGRVFAALSNETLTITFPGMAANPQYRCSMTAMIKRVGDQVSIGSGSFNYWNCGSSFLVSSGTYDATDMSINFNINFMNVSSTVKLLESECAKSGANTVGGLPSGIYCNGAGGMRYVCNDLFVDTMAGVATVFPSNFGNLTAASNDTVTATLLASWDFSVTRTEIVRYDASTMNMWSADFGGTKLTVRNSGWCPSGATWGAIPLGGFCGASAQRDVTFIAFENRIFYLAFPTSGSDICRMTGVYTWVTGSNEMSFDVTQTFGAGCTVGAGVPRLRITKMIYNSATFAVTIDGFNFTSSTAAGTAVQLTAAAGSCSLLGEETATFKVVSQGIYRSNVGSVSTVLYTIGQMWAMSINSSNSWSAAVGSYYLDPTLASTVGRVNLVNQDANIYYGSSITVNNMSQVQLPTMQTGGLSMLVDTNEGYMTLSESYMGATPASGGNSAADAKAAEEESKTTIIIAVAIGVVVVLAIVAVIVMKSRGGSSPPPTQPEGQDYHPMNSV